MCPRTMSIVKSETPSWPMFSSQWDLAVQAYIAYGRGPCFDIKDGQSTLSIAWPLKEIYSWKEFWFSPDFQAYCQIFLYLKGDYGDYS